MKRLNKHHFEDILNYAKDSLDFVQNTSYEEFISDKKSVFAVVRALEVIGESSNRIADELKEKYSHLPWIEMRGLRNRIVHNYDDIDYDIIWNVLKNDIPSLITKIELIINEID